MGREVKRVALDFVWPLTEVYEGYLMPDRLRSVSCTGCNGSGLSGLAKQLSDDWYDHDNCGRTWRYDYGVDPQGNPAERPPWRIVGTTKRWQYDLTQDEVDHLIAEGRMVEYTHDFVKGQGWVGRADAVNPTAARVNHDMLHSAMGHDGINQYILVRHRFERLYPDEPYACASCEGNGHTYRDAAHEAAHEAWEPTDPPEGEGWQMWETTSEGSPISPVCESPERLAAWLFTHGASSFGSDTATYAEWLAMIRGPGWAPSGIVRGGTVVSGIVGLADDTRLVTLRRLDLAQTGGGYAFEAIFGPSDQTDTLRGPLALIAWCAEQGISAESDYRPNGAVSVSGTIGEDEALAFKLRWQ